MDFVVDLSRTRRQHDSIWVIVDRMTKSTHFIPVKSAYKAEGNGGLYIDEILRWHGISLSIIPDRGAQFTLHFTRSFSKSLDWMAPFEAVYGRRCRSPVGLFEVGESSIFVAEIIHEAFQKILPMKGVMRFCRKWKLSSRFGVDEDLSYEDVPVEILDLQVKRMRNKEVATVKVWWRNNLV
ncbi:uncharacterized protein [Solanum lycopersicum]|uniref:uncharacterized protein n=1 Tax=Solanum lycopersicum TaxID=4081 RepID=UPI003748DCD4